MREQLVLDLHYINQAGKLKVAVINTGEIFLMPAGVPHSPRRGEGSWTLVVERKAHPGEMHYYLYYCDRCDAKLREWAQDLWRTDASA